MSDVDDTVEQRYELFKWINVEKTDQKITLQAASFYVSVPLDAF